MEEARIKMVGDASWANENVVTGILRLVRENGLFSTFGGLPAMLSKQVIVTVSDFQMSSYCPSLNKIPISFPTPLTRSPAPSISRTSLKDLYSHT
jgi:hypothetical protein